MSCLAYDGTLLHTHGPVTLKLLLLKLSVACALNNVYPIGRCELMLLSTLRMPSVGASGMQL